MVGPFPLRLVPLASPTLSAVAIRLDTGETAYRVVTHRGLPAPEPTVVAYLYGRLLREARG